MVVKGFSLFSPPLFSVVSVCVYIEMSIFSLRRDAGVKKEGEGEAVCRQLGCVLHCQRKLMET